MTDTATTQQLIEVPLDRITPDTGNRHTEPDTELINSIRELGVLQPILIRHTTNGYQLVAGERRWRAAELAGLATIPAIVHDIDDRQASIIQAIENLRRRNLTPAEEIRTIARCATLGASIEDIATKVGVSVAWVRIRVRLVELPARFLDALDNNELDWKGIEQASKLPPEILERTTPQQYEVRKAVEAEQGRKALEKELVKCQQAGINVITGGTEIWSLHLATGSDDSKHAKEPCAAVRLTAAYGGTIRKTDVCTDPKRHKAGGGSKLQARPSTTANHSAADQRRQDRTRTLTAWIADSLPEWKPTVDELAHAMVRASTGSLYITADTKRLILTALFRMEGKTVRKLNMSGVDDQLQIRGRLPADAARILIASWLLGCISAGYVDDPTARAWATAHGWTDPHPPTPTTVDA